MIGLLAALWIATDDARQLCADVLQAMQRADITRQQFADYAGLDEKAAYDQLACKKPLNLWRLAQLPTRFMVALIAVIAERHGQLVVAKEQVSLIVQIHESKRPMLKASLPQEFFDERKRA